MDSDRSAAKKWLRVAELNAKRLAATSRRFNVSDAFIQRQLLEERSLLDQEFSAFEQQLLDDVSRIKRLLNNVKFHVSHSTLISEIKPRSWRKEPVMEVFWRRR